MNQSTATMMSNFPITPEAPGRVVSFSPYVRVLRTTHLKNFTKEEIQNCWYTDTEKNIIRQDAMDIVKNFNTSSSASSASRYCTRGLRHLTPNGRQEVMERRFRAWDLVLDEQEFQMSKGVVDEERIAHLYGKSVSIVKKMLMNVDLQIKEQHYKIKNDPLRWGWSWRRRMMYPLYNDNRWTPLLITRLRQWTAALSSIRWVIIGLCQMRFKIFHKCSSQIQQTTLLRHQQKVSWIFCRS